MKTQINFGWKYIRGYKDEYLTKYPSDASTVDIPHAPVEEPLDYFDEASYQDLFTYEKDFDVPDYDHVKMGADLVFDGVMLKVHPYLNGVDLGEQISGWIPVRYGIAEILKPKGNHLIVVVDSREDPHVPPFGKAVDYLTFAGIYRRVYIDTYPLAHFTSFHAQGDMKGHLKIKKMTVNADEASLVYRLYKGGKLIKEFATDEIDIPNVDLWSLDQPNLYRLTATLKSAYGEDTQELFVGFRDAKFTTKGFLLNGKKIKLLGLNRHQNYPYVGPAMPASAQRDDAEILKIKLGINVVRTSHYPQSEDFLRRCDELGLMVIDEIPGWQYLGKDEAWRNNFLRFLNGMVTKEEDHPSVIAYGVRIDESADDDDLYSQANTLAHQLDPTRQTLGVRNFKNSHCLEDVYAYNDFSCSSTSHGLDDPKTWKGAKGKPCLVTEHNGHMYVTKQFSGVHRRLEQALRHSKVMDDMYGYDNLTGAIGWCAFDYNTHKDFGSGDHICHHGVYDLFRSPKAAAYAYASQNATLPVMWVANTPTPGDNDEALLKPLVVFTNCDYVEFYKNGSFVEAFFPDNKHFPHLPHAPIVIDDFVGRTFSEPNIKSPKDAQKIVKALNLVGQTGIAHLGPKDLMPYLGAIMRNHLKYEDLLAMYYKYMSGWGEKAVTWTIKGFKDRKPVTEKKFGPSLRFSYRYEVQSQDLQNADTYDTSRVTIKFVDEYGTQLHYAQRVITFETMGPIEIIGPKTVPLYGGDVSVYVRSKDVDRPMSARLVIKTDLGDYPIDFNVQ